MEYGIQLYSLRDITKEGRMEDALAAVAEMGYTHVEFAGFCGIPAEQIVEWLNKYGLKISGTHTSYKELREDVIDETVAYHKAIGNKNLIIPGADTTTAEKIDELIALITAAKPKLDAAGITLGFHNHSVEFLPNADGQIPFDELRTRTDIDFEIDTYWAWNAGKDPVALMEEMKDRVHVIHLKDGLEGGIGRSLGSGNAPVKEVLAAARRLGIFPVVESEGLDPTGAEEVGRCMDYLKEIEG